MLTTPPVRWDYVVGVVVSSTFPNCKDPVISSFAFLNLSVKISVIPFLYQYSLIGIYLFSLSLAFPFSSMCSQSIRAGGFRGNSRLRSLDLGGAKKVWSIFAPLRLARPVRLSHWAMCVSPTSQVWGSEWQKPSPCRYSLLTPALIEKVIFFPLNFLP